jgi:hypothetical protein
LFLNNKNKALLTPASKKVAKTTAKAAAVAASSSNKKKNNSKAGKNTKKTKKKAAPPATVLDVTAPIAPLSKQEWRKRVDEIFVSPPPNNNDTAQAEELRGRRNCNSGCVNSHRLKRPIIDWRTRQS